MKHDVVERAIVIARGERPEREGARRLESLLAERARVPTAVIALDHVDPRADYTVGDGDSLAAAEKAALGARFIHEEEQETNDLAKAFRFARRLGARELVIFGATGRREDHAIGNIFHLAEFAAAGMECSIVSDWGEFTVVLPGAARRYAAETGDAFSVFAVEPGTEAVSEGLAWPLAGADLSRLWAGTLNRATAREVVVSANRPLIVYRAFP